jgi:hypothetical protein
MCSAGEIGRTLLRIRDIVNEKRECVREPVVLKKLHQSGRSTHYIHAQQVVPASVE